MKKILFTLLLSIFLISGVKAETIILESTNNDLESKTFKVNGSQSFNDAYNFLLSHFDSNEYKYYVIYYLDSQEMQSNSMRLIAFNDNSYSMTVTSNYVSIKLDDTSALSIKYTYATDSVFESIGSPDSFNFFKYNTISLIDTNFDFVLQGASYEIQGFYSDSIFLESGDILPTYLNLKNYDSWANYPIINIKIDTVNLDNYEYVILNLKDYSKKDVFETNLQVKGSVGITPVYEFGTVEKEFVTDRCNLSYSDFTDYRFFILKNDLLNNAVYYVKGCEEGSSFKFDNTVFNVTYITTENVDDPVVTFGGVEHHTIPFNKLSNTANKNEEEGFIPGASEQFNPFESVADYITSFWNSLSTFMGLVTKFFNTLPIEIRAVAITAFTTAVTLGVIKFIKS